MSSHGRRVSRSAHVGVGVDSWSKAYFAVFLEEGFVALECGGRVTTNTSFDYCILRRYAGSTILKLVQACYSVEDEGSVVDCSIIPYWIKKGLQERSTLSSLQGIQRDEETGHRWNVERVQYRTRLLRGAIAR